MRAEKVHLLNILFLAVLAYLFLMFGNQIVSLTNPDEVFYTQTAKEMAQQKTWMTPYLFGALQFEKPIFLYWLLRIGFLIFGVNSFSARFFPALFGILGIIAIYLLSAIGFKNQKKAFLASLIMMSSGLYIGLSRSVFTDLIFTVFILFCLVSFFWAYSNPRKKGPGIILAFFFIGCAILSKGPLGFLIPALAIFLFLAVKKELKFLASWYFFWGFLIMLAVSLPWYVLMAQKYGNTFTDEFFYNDHIRRLLEAEHPAADTWYFYPLTMAWGIFPWSVYAVIAVFLFLKDLYKRAEPLYLFCAAWILGTVLIFQPAHSKLSSYIFPLFPALAIITGDFIYEAIVNKKWQRALFIATLATGIVLVIFDLALLAAILFFPNQILAYISSVGPMYLWLILFLGITALYFIALKKKKYILSFYALIFFIPAMFCIVPLVDSKVEPFISSRDACEYLLKNHKIKNTIITSKFYARGVHYYTDMPVAVIDIPGKPYFSPHPVPFLDSDQKVADFIRRQGKTYCVLKKSSVEDIDRLAKEFNYQVIKSIGNVFVVEIAPREGK